LARLDVCGRGSKGVFTTETQRHRGRKEKIEKQKKEKIEEEE
jgi:hypothetical protein